MVAQKQYLEYINFKRTFIIFLFFLTLLVSLFAMAYGSSNLSFSEIFSTLLGQGTRQSQVILFNIRLPRVVTAVVAGIGLATVGCVMQALLRNPLASSSTLGISQGAAFGAAIAIIVFGAGMQNQTPDGLTINNPYLVSICAFVCSMISSLVILALSRFKNLTPEMMILCGVALSALFAGGTTILQYFADDVKVAAVIFWTFGSLGNTSWREITIMLVVVFISLGYFFANTWNYNALQNGESTAKGLGVNVERNRLTGMVICSFTASVIVSYIGIINFIGLIAPHLMRRIVGSDYRYLLPASALTGAVLLLLSDVFARLVVQPIILPIGAITSFLGAPLFMYLIFRGGARR